jgi:hypothetical protein
MKPASIPSARSLDHASQFQVRKFPGCGTGRKDEQIADDSCRRIRFMTLISPFTTLYAVEQQHEATSSYESEASIGKDPLLSQLELDTEVEDLDHEELFYITIKSCIPAEKQKCKRIRSR